jgi:hypothetical protein
MLAAIVAGLLLLQVAFVGAPALAGDAGVICSTPEASGGKGEPAAPHRRHTLCCVLHCGAVGAPPPHPQVSLIAPAELSTALASPASNAAPAPRLEPKGAPQSPRAPPFPTQSSPA